MFMKPWIKVGLCCTAAALAAAQAWSAPTKVYHVSGLSVTLGSPISNGNLAVFPVRLASRLASSRQYLTLEEALKKHLIVVQELPEKEVNRVQVTSLSSIPIYLLAGDIILGGQQDREVAHDTVVPPYVKNFLVDVFCVEHGRWEGEQRFGSAEVASTSLRYQTQGAKSQAQVWSKVAADTRAMKAETPTGTYRAVGSGLHKEVDAYVKPAAARLESDPRAVGLIVAINGKVVAADAFDGHRLFLKELAKVLKSYALDAAQQNDAWKKLSRKPQATSADAGSFLAMAASGQHRTTGQGRALLNAEIENPHTYNFMAFPTDAAGKAAPSAVHFNAYSKAGMPETLQPAPPMQQAMPDLPMQNVNPPAQAPQRQSVR